MVITIRIEVENGTVTAVETEKEVLEEKAPEAVYAGEGSFGSNLKRIRKEKSMSQEELADELEVSQQCIANWENGNRNPSVTVVPEIAKALGCGIEELYLCESSFGSNLKRLRKAKGVYQGHLAEVLSTDRSTIAKWETGVAMPTADKLPLLAKVLGCTIDELYGE